MGYTRCFVDCTNTVNSGHNTGIQRVVRNIVSRLSHANKYSRVTFVPVISVGGDFYEVATISGKSFFCVKALRHLFEKGRNLVNFLFSPTSRRKDWPVDIVTHQDVHTDLHSQVVSGSRKILFVLLKYAYLFDGIIASSKPVAMGKGDVFFIADTFWKKELVETVCRVNEAGLRVVMLVYDIIAVTHDNVFEPNYRKNFEECLKKYLPIVQGVISISSSALDDIVAYASRFNGSITYDYFYLGADFGSFGAVEGAIRDEMKDAMSRSNLYLMVGTIEPRKNHAQVLSAFELLWREGHDVTLCIIGREGWMCGEVMGRISSSSELGRRLFCFNDANDRELEFCYENSKALLIASVVEGFGLPLVEAMHFGKPVFASDIPVFREIGQDYPIYFDLHDPRSLADQIEGYENGGVNRHFTATTWMSWDESVQSLLGKVAAMVDGFEEEAVTVRGV